MFPKCLVQAVPVGLALLALGCPSSPKDGPPDEPPSEAPSQPPAPPEVEAEATARKPPPALEEPADPNEACGQMIVVSYEGAKYAAPDMKRDKAEATARAAELLIKLGSGAAFEEVAKVESDAPSSAPRGGVMGTYTKEEWPAVHKALKEPLFNLKVHELAPQPIEADYGYVLLRRCKVEKVNSRHILVRYKGAKRAGSDVERSKQDALERANELREKLSKSTDFAALAKVASDDSSAANGGELGARGRGLLAQAYEETLFSLSPGEISDPVETEFGYHIIQRLPEAAE